MTVSRGSIPTTTPADAAFELRWIASTLIAGDSAGTTVIRTVH